jgi:hypothetical protein
MKQLKTLKKTKITLLSAFLASSLLFANCEFGSQSDSNDDSGLLVTLLALDNQAKAAAEAAKQCVTTYNSSANNDLGNLIELCTPSAGRGRHFRFENVGMTGNNGYMNLLIGYGAFTSGSSTTEFPQLAGAGAGGPGTGPLAPTTTTDDGRWRIFFGKSQSCNRAWFVPNFSGTNSGTTSLHELFMTQAVSTTLSAATCPADQGGANQASGIWGPSTICMDVTRGTTGSSPRITVWATGKNGADCSNLSSLTDANKIYSKNYWTSRVQTRDDRVYIYRSNDSTSMDRVVVRSETAIKD